VKRSAELAVLSREHHIALELALRLKRAAADQVDLLARDASDFWRRESSEHFRLEEDFLLPSLARHAAADDPDIERVRSEHDELRRRFAELDGGGRDVPALRELGRLLGDHVRFEERVLFPRVESALDPDELAELGRRLRGSS
jgi:iron-sulfur cluster repair protein YtfE (RIC family)